MNERIKELIKEAGISTGDYYRNLDDSSWTYSKPIVDGWSDEFKQQLNLEPYLRIREMDEAQLTKFVELIIQDCVKILNHRADTSADYLDSKKANKHARQIQRDCATTLEYAFGLKKMEVTE